MLLIVGITVVTRVEHIVILVIEMSIVKIRVIRVMVLLLVIVKVREAQQPVSGQYATRCM